MHYSAVQCGKLQSRVVANILRIYFLSFAAFVSGKRKRRVPVGAGETPRGGISLLLYLLTVKLMIPLFIFTEVSRIIFPGSVRTARPERLAGI